MIKRTNRDTVISFLDYNNLFVILVKILINKKIKIIISERTDPCKHKSSIIFSLSRILLYNLADILVIQDSSFKNFFWFVNKKKVKIIRNLYLDENKKKNNTFKSNFTKRKNYFYVVSAGRLTESKRFLNIIKIIESLENKKIIFHIYGEGQLKKKINDYINKKKLKKLIILKGWKKNLQSIYKNYDLFLFNSYYEGIPNVLLEASYSGIPIISFEYNPGVKLIVKDRINGFVVRSENELKNKTELLLNNPKLLIKMKNNNVHLKKNFDEANILKKWKSIIT